MPRPRWWPPRHPAASSLRALSRIPPPSWRTNTWPADPAAASGSAERSRSSSRRRKASDRTHGACRDDPTGEVPHRRGPLLHQNEIENDEAADDEHHADGEDVAHPSGGHRFARSVLIHHGPTLAARDRLVAA